MASVHTIGHSTRPLADFLSLLEAHGVTELWDVRRFPASRRHPQFGKAALESALRGKGIAYRHEEALGGRREPAAGELNAGLRDPAFRGYADHMRTAAFTEALDRLTAAAGRAAAAVMCAEADFRHCHRRLLSDALVARGVSVLHITGLEPAAAHVLDPAAAVGADGTVRYPARGPRQGRLFRKNG
jgi:uncharacterized protein (DUF488 family)